MNSLYNMGIKGKLYRLLFNMNKDTRIRVKTAFGVTEEVVTGENVGQGTIEGADISAANIDYGVNHFFKNSNYELSYGSVRLQPMLFQDDISRLCLDVRSAQIANDLLGAMMETKLLDFNIEKSCYIVIGPAKEKEKLSKQLQVNPLMLSRLPMKGVMKEKYLGDQISAGGLTDSILDTIAGRKGKMMSSILEVKTIMEDCRINTVGGISSGLTMWEAAIIPFLMNNSETWTQVNKAAINILDKCQNTFLRLLLATPVACPTPALVWETGCLTMKFRIIQQKLLFYHHLLNLPPTSLANQVALTQHRLGYPGLIQECHQMCTELDLPDIIENPGMGKVMWKRMVKKAVRDSNRDELLNDIKENYTKLDFEALKEEQFQIKPYIKELKMNDARIKFSLRSKMTRTVQMNFSNDRKYADNLWQCSGCGCIDSQLHLLWCDGYKNLREGKDLSSDRDLVEYYRLIMKHRDEEENI